MSLQSTSVSETDVATEPTRAVRLHQLPQHIIGAGLGLLSGAAGVTLAIGLAIVIQWTLPPTTIISSIAIPVTMAGILLGLGIAWLVSRIIPRIVSGLPAHFTEPGLQVLLVFSILASLLQGFLFLGGL